MVSMGLLATWNGTGKKIVPFKKGPDYIDASWLSRASGLPCYNLDTYLMGEDGAYRSFLRRIRNVDGAIIEGNRGLFDGVDPSGTHSTAVLARLLTCPVLLVVDCTKATRTVAATILGCQSMDRALDIRGVVLNRVAGDRHGELVQACIEQECGLPIVGRIPRDQAMVVPERYLGLVPWQEHWGTEEVVRNCRIGTEEHLDLSAIWSIAECAPAMQVDERDVYTGGNRGNSVVRIGVILDSSFHFYYPENLEALEAEGGRVIEIKPGEDVSLQDVDALYIGGGFPEIHAETLSRNELFKASVREAVEEGLPVYAECGGALYLGKGIEIEDRFYPMTGVFPVAFRLDARPQGHGYTLVEVKGENPYFSKGVFFKGHEFHYCRAVSLEDDRLNFVCRVRRGYGFDGVNEGLCYKNVFATFSHIHALGERQWAKSVIMKASWYRGEKGAANCI